MESVQNTLNTTSEAVGNFLSNTWVTAFVFMFVLVFASTAAPRLPPSIASIFQYTWVKVLFIALILYMNQINSGIAILLAIIFFFGLQSLSQTRMFNFMDHLNESTAQLKKKYQEMVARQQGQQSEVPPTPRQISAFNPNMTDFDGVEQVSGVVERSPDYFGPQGMENPSGFGESLAGAEIQHV